ncbi:MAG TPA: ADP-glyceromanno-heptose 6-epimerase [Bacteroidota bacterium]
MIAVTGAAGFIGSNLATRLATAGSELVLIDHPLTPGKHLNWPGLKGFRFLEHLNFLDELEQNRLTPDAVFHLGACSSTTETDWNFLLKNNLEYSQRLWNWCAREQKPLVYASSAATYGDGSLGFDDTTHPEKLRPLNLYGRSKNDFDIWVYKQIAEGRKTPLRWAGLKFFNVYGPREAHKGAMASVVWKAYQQIMTNGEVKLFRSNDPAIKDGEQKRDFVFVEDCIDHMLWLWQSPHAGGLYNSGTGLARTFLDLVLAVFSALNKEPRIQFIDMPAELSEQYQNFTEATMEKIRSTGFTTPHTSLENGVTKYLTSLRS